MRVFRSPSRATTPSPTRATARGASARSRYVGTTPGDAGTPAAAAAAGALRLHAARLHSGLPESHDPAWDATLVPSRIPTTPNQYGSNGQAVLSVRQSRFGLIAALPADQDARGVIEFDFFGVGADAGKTIPRLRHAYGQWRALLAGQTWSVFMTRTCSRTTSTIGVLPAGSHANATTALEPLRGRHELAIAIRAPEHHPRQ